MATNTNLKAALSFTGSQIGIPDRTVGNAALLRLQAWFEAEFAAQLGGNTATANDIASYLWDHLATRVKHYEAGVAQAALTPPTELDDTV